MQPPRSIHHPFSSPPFTVPPPPSMETRGDGGCRCAVDRDGQSGRRATVHGGVPSPTAAHKNLGEEEGLRTLGGRRHRERRGCAGMGGVGSGAAGRVRRPMLSAAVCCCAKYVYCLNLCNVNGNCAGFRLASCAIVPPMKCIYVWNKMMILLDNCVNCRNCAIVTSLLEL